MKILVFGGTGLLGQALKKEALKRGFEFFSCARNNADFCLDITDDCKVKKAVWESSADVVINACAIVNHKICDENPDLAYKTNARPSLILANLAEEYGFKYVYVSTDGYFHGDGKQKHNENAKVRLLNEYAKTKFEGEKFALENKNALVVRTNIVGFRNKEGQPTFVEWAIEALKSGEKMTLFDDYFTSSISTAQFSNALFDLLKKDSKGLINLASSEVSSKKEFIETLAKEFDFSLKNTVTGKVSSLTTSKRADSLGLDVSKAEKLLGYNLPTLNEVIKQLKAEYCDV